MLSKSEKRQKYFNTSSYEEARDIYNNNIYMPKLPLSSWTKLQLPYLAPNHPELPSFEDIQQALKKNQFPWSPVCQIGDLFVKLSHDGWVVQEAETLLYLRANSSLRLPTVHAVLTAEDENGRPIHYMVMSRVPGNTLSPEKWLTLPSTTRTQILASIREQIRLMRALPAPGYYGLVHKQGWRPLHEVLREQHANMCGPYETYAEFSSAVYATAEIETLVVGDAPDFFPTEVGALEELQDLLQNEQRGREPKFTHVDLALKNVVVRPIGGDEHDAKDWEATIIDWADAGWWPAWMQVVATKSRMNMSTLAAGSRIVPNEEAREEILHGLFQGSGEDGYEDYLKVNDSVNYNLAHSIG
ncbi:hypothetical protein FB567DRAFT_553202 [Paraphoma chrysanthemicola]|uniref:Aminoglycoside phosphotransferase domain-containing protein n=1 Tax=Paraphoma chrysanthemicola TaxID=798071 RepID=A0A8K0QYQ5_9PLEO|nr:hypothetical protein FB567DRAFT_553202 [Paraphoma chrysanthemicola]